MVLFEAFQEQLFLLTSEHISTTTNILYVLCFIVHIILVAELQAGDL